MRWSPILVLFLVCSAHGEATCPLTPAQMRGIRVWDQGRTGVMRSPVPGMIHIAYHAQFKNETPRELASLSVRLLVDSGNRRAYVSPVATITRFENLSVPLVGAIVPMNKTGYVENIAFDIPARLWRTDIFDRIEVVGASTFVNPNLHDPGHLYARLLVGKDEEEIGLLQRDPSLLKVKGKNGFDVTLMAFAACGTKMIRYVLAHGGNPKAHTDQGTTIMHMAALDANPGVDDLALKLGGNVNAKTKHGKTPLMRAIVYGLIPTQNWLLAHGADPRYEESPGHTVSQYVIREGQIPALAALVKAGVSPRVKDSTGQGWFHYAVFNWMMMDTIKSYGVPVDDPNPKTGETALMTAAWAGWTEPRVWLLQHGAYPNRKDKKGRTAYDYAAHHYGTGQRFGPTVTDRFVGSREDAFSREYFANLVRQYATKR